MVVFVICSIEGRRLSRQFTPAVMDMTEEDTHKGGCKRRLCNKESCWKPTSTKALEEAEQNVLRYVKADISGKYVDIGGGHKLWTLEVSSGNEADVPLVLVHGLGAGVGMWAKNYDALASKQKIFAIDVLGFGRSSRPTFPTDGKEAERLFVESVEKWRVAMNLDKFNLLGHSLGGFIVFSYASQYPQYIKHLILADPWGVAERPPESEIQQYPRWVRAVFHVLNTFNPFSAIRAAGPWGPSVLKKVRKDIGWKFEDMFGEEDDSVLDYLYHCNAQNPSGEIAIKSMAIPFGWAKHPMIQRIEEIDPSLPITFIYGEKSWMDSDAGSTIKEARGDSYVEVRFIEHAGHHVYVDDVDTFNEFVLDICSQ